MMENFYIWPGSPMASLFVLWVASVIFLWAGRSAMLQLIKGLGEGLANGLSAVERRCISAADVLQETSREVLLAVGTRDAQARLDRELQRVDAGFSDQLGQYGRLQRRLDDTLIAVDKDYQQGGVAPPEVPGWSAAVEAIANIPMAGDPNIQKVLDGIRQSSEEAEKKTLAAYRADTAKRHKILGGMLPVWKEIRSGAIRSWSRRRRAWGCAPGCAMSCSRMRLGSQDARSTAASGPSSSSSMSMQRVTTHTPLSRRIPACR